MQGLVLVTWEKFLTDQFGEAFVTLYRKSIKQAPFGAPLVSQTYADEVLQMAVEAAVKLANIDTRRILYAYGRYFMTSPLVNHHYGYIFSRVHNARDILLVMSKAHTQMGLGGMGITLPLFTCTPLDGKPDGMTLIYEGPYQLCALLHGAIIGAGEYYKERVLVKERFCVLKGDKSCLFDVMFAANSHTRLNETDVQQQQRLQQQETEYRVLLALPYTQIEARSLLELQQSLALRPLTLLEALNHLQFVGLISVQPARELVARRYWRTPPLLQ